MGTGRKLPNSVRSLKWLMFKNKTMEKEHHQESGPQKRPQDTETKKGRVARRRARTRQEILLSSSRLFSRLGFDAVRFEDIANAADVARGTLYSFFKNKEVLLEELVSSIYQKYTNGLERIKQSDPRKRIEELLNVYCDLWETDPNGMLVAYNIQSLPDQPYESLTENFSRRLDEIFKAAENFLRSNDSHTSSRLFSRTSIPSLEVLGQKGDFRKQFIEHFKNLLLKDNGQSP